MTDIRLVKKYPHIKDEDVASIFQEGYIKGFENGRKGAIPIGWIDSYCTDCTIDLVDNDEKAIIKMVKDWEKENGTI